MTRELTPRERDVLSATLAGLSIKETARKLDIAENTVKVHRRNIQSVSGNGRLPDLVILARRNNVLTYTHPLVQAFNKDLSSDES